MTLGRLCCMGQSSVRQGGGETDGVPVTAQPGPVTRHGWSSRPGRARNAVATASAVIAAALLIMALLLPHVGGRLPVLFLLVAFHALFLLCVGAFAVVVGIVGAALRSRWTMVVAVVVVIAVGVAFAVPASVRSPGADPAQITASGRGTLRVLEWNTDQQDVDATTIRTLIAQTDPDIVVLPEYFEQIARGSLAEIAKQRDMQVLGWDSSASTLLVARSLGGYSVDHRDAPAWAGFVAVPTNPTSPRLVITHLQRPDITSTARWRQHVTWAANQCTGNSLAVGDFNATVDNISPSRTLGGCVDSATALGQDPQGTWPTVLPGSLGATIDHVFTGPSWKPAVFSVLDGLDRAGSDHRPTFAVLTRAA